MLSGVWNLVMGHSGGRQHTQDRATGEGEGAGGSTEYTDTRLAIEGRGVSR
jgi:hypothetical protein